MKFTKTMLCLATLGLAVASAGSSYNVTVVNPTTVGDTVLKPGGYKLEMVGDKAVFTSGKNTVEAPATMEKGDQKYPYTTLETSDSKLKEIRVGGTNMKIVFMPSSEHAQK